MATQSRARMFQQTARALRSATDRRLEGAVDPTLLLADIDERPVPADVSLDIPRHASFEFDRAELMSLHAEFRWAESRLMQASERLAEAEEARRKDLVALERMRLDISNALAAEHRYLEAQATIFRSALPTLGELERELERLVEGGATTEQAITELAAVRAERKLYELALGQVAAQLAIIAENQAVLDHDTFLQRYEREPSGESMREAARLQRARQDAEQAAARSREALGSLMDDLDIERRAGEMAAIAAFLAAEVEGDGRARARVEAARAAQAARELDHLPAPTPEWKAGLRHPISWMRARRTTRD